MKFRTICIVLSVCQMIIFAGIYYYFSSTKEFRCTCKKYQVPFPLAKASATLINLSLSLTLLSIVRFPKKFLYIPFQLKHLHLFFSVWLFIWSIIHSVSHYITFIKFSYSLTTTFIGMTGNTLLMLLVIMSISSAPYVRKFIYQYFLYMHYVLLVLFTIVLNIHGNLCFLKNDSKDCIQSTTWIWLLIPLVYMLGYTIYKFTNKVKLKSYYDYKNDIYELELELDKRYSGKTIWLCCPSISYLEWHPFTVAFYKNKSCYIYFKKRGDWTNNLANYLIEHDNIYFLVEGPYYSVPKNMIKQISSQNVMLISSGVGITTFIDVYRQLAKQLKRNKDFSICKLYIFIIIRYEVELNWLIDLLILLNKISNVHIRIYYTGEKSWTLNNYSLPHTIGRPDFRDIFEYMSDETYIYYSGKTTLGKKIKDSCKHKRNFKFEHVV